MLSCKYYLTFPRWIYGDRQWVCYQFLEETTFYNGIILSHLLPANLWEPLPHFLQTWLRNYLAGNLLYFISGFLWCFYIYYLKLNVYIPKGKRTRYRVDGTKIMKVYLEPTERNNTEYKLETMVGVYRRLTGRDVDFEYPTTQA